MSLAIAPYSSAREDEWNGFNASARNGHFLFDRRFMEYHSDRFTDASLVILDENEIVGLLPANRSGDRVFSHQGLTFGGLVTGSARTPAVMEMLDLVAHHYRAEGCTALTYKPVPHIYHRQPSETDLYWLFRNGAQLVRRDASSTIRHADRGAPSSRRKRGAAKAQKSGLGFGPSQDWAAFWQVLSDNLAERHGVAPVHSLAEITSLAAALPDHIKLYAATDESGALVAGVVAFDTPMVMHAQYIGSSAEGRNRGALDGLFEHVIGASAAAGQAYFDFGISTEDQGRTLNDGLISYKEEFGASATVYDAYELSL